MKKIICVIGARPNFMKMVPVIAALKEHSLQIIIVHTQQHYDNYMSKQILDDLNFPDPDYELGVMGGSHATQTGRIMISFEKICININPVMVIVAGDVNSTMACGLVAAKLHIKLAHVESGLRSYDKKMPEEINRIATDHISDILFTTEESANENLLKEGIDSNKIHFVGNCMIDTLDKFLPAAKENQPWIKYGLEKGGYNLITLHRPSNVDDPNILEDLCITINKISQVRPTIFPIHPRTMKQIFELKIKFIKEVIVVKPLPYIEFLGLLSESFVVITDSGGIQEETTALGINCITVRENTERPITIELGTNQLTGTNHKDIIKAYDSLLKHNKKNIHKIPPLWDGRSAYRISKIIMDIL